MKNILKLVILSTFVLIFNSCGKKESTPPASTPTPTAKYYAKFKVDGVQKEFRSSTLQTGHSIFGGYDQVGGYCNDGNSLANGTLGVTIYNRDDSITEQEFTGFVGQTFFFDDAKYYIELNYQDINPVTNEYDSYNYLSEDHKYSISISNIVRIGTSPDKDLNGKFYDIYEVTGTCSGYLLNSDGTHNVEITEGQFFFRWTKANH